MLFAGGVTALLYPVAKIHTNTVVVIDDVKSLKKEVADKMTDMEVKMTGMEVKMAGVQEEVASLKVDIKGIERMLGKIARKLNIED